MADVVLSLPAGAPEGSKAWLLDALPLALAALERHGLRLFQTTEVRLYENLAAFREGSGRRASWLRAWTEFQRVHVSPPRAWRHRSARALLERLTHELCHAAVFQSFGSEKAALFARIPWWFSEGTASVVADQGARRAPLDVVLAWAGEESPLERTRFSHGEEALAYSAAHHAMALVKRRHGPQVFGEVLRLARRDGAPGCVERSLLSRAKLDAKALWRALLEGGRPS